MNKLTALFVEEVEKKISYTVYDTEYVLKSPFNILFPVLTIVCLIVMVLIIKKNDSKKFKIILCSILLVAIIFMIYCMVLTSGMFTIRGEWWS